MESIDGDLLSVCTAHADDQLPVHPEAFFKNSQIEQLEGIKYPLCTTHLDVTTDCNFDCPTCIESQYRQTRTYLSLHAVRKVLGDIHQLGCRDLRLYGGEPTLHPELSKIILHALSLGFSIRVVTNGSMLDNKDLIEAITSSERVCVRVSINADDPKTHSIQHGCPDTELHTIKKKVTYLISSHGRVSISYLLTPHSIQELDNACQFWRQAGAETLSLRMITAPHGLQDKFRFSEDARREILKVVNQHHDWISFASGSEDWIISGNTPEQQRYKYCYSGYFRLIVSPFISSTNKHGPVQGSELGYTVTDRMWLSTCPYHRNEESSGRMYPDSLLDWWINDRREWLDNLWPKMQSCPDTICSRNSDNNRIHDALQGGG